jgi:Ca2+-binding RTX toxin-like protein
MISRRLPHFIGLGLLAILASAVMGAFAAANTVPATWADDLTRAISANDLKPTACAGLNLTTIVTGSGGIGGTSGNDLILGSPGDDAINGLQGDDCILAGDGNDTLRGQGGNDVCDGGNGTDTGHNSCEVEIDIP